ncbi:hypothetical protein COH20_012725 [Aspergillus flavus]|uniref:Uncharacterized protein n=1 Tax=Aspergillus oryzae TaxID=5062 RepID=A0A1S9DX70_ASPOZ|nr:hypothetical protein OAory_01014200 [Aspergillus oryzae]RAQ55727.1 hypothetical protein AFGD_012519 [Aspergillus flavus]RAQ63002.1 hypothetical protein COH20_012725 [Aspergillus flavus]RAQ71678.1 hypothetical protein COH21_011987 [Aspergillus flavus]
MARIVLLADACVNGTGSLQDEIRYGEVAEALRILEDARSHSLAAANLLQSLMQVLEKHRAYTTPVMSVATAQMYQRPDTLSLSGTPNPVDANRSGPLGAVPDQTPVTTGQSSYGNQLAQSLEELVDIDGFQWDDLFSGMDGSTFF